MSQFFSAPNIVTAVEVWGVFTRLLGLVYLVAFVSLYPQILALAGSRGIGPVQPMLRKIAADFPAPQRFCYFPTLLWISASDTMLRALVAAGATAALVVIVGGPFSPVALLVCWLAYLSLDKAVGLAFPWDALLLECGFLALFLPPLLRLPNLAAAAEPAPLLAWAFGWLLFRVVFGFGKFKFTGADHHDTSYLRGFLINQPMPTRLGWYGHHLPHWIHRLALKLMFVVEVVVPFLIFVPGDARVVAAVTIGGLMVAIQLSGNFGFFNLLVLALCVPLLTTPAAPWAGPYTNADLPMLAVLGVVMLGGLVNLPYNSWCAQSWHYWPSQFALHIGWLRRILDFYRLIQPLRVTHAYGIFPPASSPPVRWIAQIEGSEDGTTWRAFRLRWLPTGPESPPPRIAPFHPRLDHAHYYEGFGTAAVFLSSLFGTGNPYAFSRVTLLQRLVQRLLEGEPAVLRLFAANPFPAGPPACIRVRCYLLQPTSPSERRRSGAWWSMHLIGDQLPSVRRDDTVWQRCLCEPELFHWDELIWKRRAPAMRALMARARAADGPLSASILPAPGLTPADLTAFWDELMPVVSAADRTDWDGITALVQDLRARFDAAQLARFERVLGRLSVALAARLEPLHFSPTPPRLMPDSYFHLGMLIHHIVCHGRAAYEAVARTPATAAGYAEDLTPAEGLFLCGIFWHEALILQARKLRLLMPFNEIKFQAGLPGILTVLPFLAEQFQAETNDTLPIFAQSPRTGAWTVVSPAPAPQAVAESSARPQEALI